MVTPLDTLVPFSPVNPVTPFTYRDTATFQTILKSLEDRLNQLIDEVNAGAVEENDNLNTAIADLRNNINLTIQNLYNELVTLIDGSHDESLADDPTTGKRVQGLSTVVGNVYDNVRIFAYFAGQFDALGMTCAEFEALNWSARHFDLAPLYPTLNDVYES